METTASDTAEEREFGVTGLKDLGVPDSENSDSVFVSLATREKTGLRFAASRAFVMYSANSRSSGSSGITCITSGSGAGRVGLTRKSSSGSE